MPAWEQTIRAFESKAVSPPLLQGPGPIGPPASDVRFEFGQGTITTFSWSYNTAVSAGRDKTEYKEISRVEKTKRVFNPDDNSQFVDIAQPKKIKLQNRDDPEDQRTYWFDMK
jgi:hypothetical protein